MDTNPSGCISGIVLNLTGSNVASSMLHKRTDYIFTNIIVPLVMTLGILGNSAFIFAVWRVKSMQTITNAYLVNMAVADIVFLSSSVITVYGYYASPVGHDAFFTSWIGCTLAWGLPYMLYFTSLLSVSFVTIERYCAICSPIHHRSVAGKKRNTRLLTFTWICGALFGVCVTPAHGKLVSYCVMWPETDDYSSFPKTIEYCVPFPSRFGNIFAQLVQISPFVLAMFGNMFMYCRILQELSSRPESNSNVVDEEGNMTKTKFQTIRNQVARLLIANGLVFFICQAPFRLINIEVILLYTIGQGMFTTSQFDILVPIGRTMIMVNACINVFVYLLTSSYYRRGFAQAFGWRTIRNWSSMGDSKTNSSHVSTAITQSKM